jgi:hypothetical protein
VLTRVCGPRGGKQQEAAESYIMRSYINVTPKQEDKVGGTCSMHGRYENSYNISMKNLKGRDQLGDLGVDDRIILQWSFI